MCKLRSLLHSAVVPVICAQLAAHAVWAQVGQSTNKSINVAIATSNMWQPVWITKVQIGTQFLIAPDNPTVAPQPGQIVSGQQFMAGNNWVREMMITVMNRTDNPIAWLSVSLRFSQTGNGHTRPILTYPIQIGRIPDVDKYTGYGKPLPAAARGTAPLRLQPGNTLVIRASDFIDKIKAQLESAMPLASIRQAYIYVDACVLDDGTRWAGGAYSKPDSQQPGQWLYEARGYFPGDAHRYLPNVVTRAGSAP